MTADVRHAGRAALLSAALRYAEMGWNVFPCWWINADRNCACGVACKSPGKHPIAALVPHGQDNASTEPKIIKGWWQRFPDANIGVAMSRNGLVAIDVDPRNGGLETVDALRERHGSLESDVQQITGGGGDHYIYRAPEGVTLPGKLGPGVDVKHHGYIMAWPSNHISGSLYQWEASSDPTEGMVAPPLPDWISALAAVPVASMAAIQTHRHIDEVTAGELASALEVTPSDDRDTWVRVMMALRQSGQQGWDLWDGWSRKSSKYDPADSRRVWHTARPRGEINYESIFTLAESHGWVNPAKVPKPTPEQKTARRADLLRLVRDSDAKAPPKVKARQQITVAPLPNDSLQGVLNWISLSYPQSHPLVSAGAVLAVLATAAARRYVSDRGDALSLYVAPLAPVSSWSRYALRAAERIMDASGMHLACRTTRLSSPQAVYSGFLQAASTLYLADDYGEQLAFSRRQPSGLLAAALSLVSGRLSTGDDILLDSWADLGFVKRPEDSLPHRPHLRAPALSMLAMIGGDQVGKALSRAELSRGALDNMLLLPALDDDDWQSRPAPRPTPVPEPGCALLRQIRGIARTSLVPNPDMLRALAVTSPGATVVAFGADPEPREQLILSRFKGAGMAGRALAEGSRTTLRRVACLLAVASNPAAPIVQDDHLTWAYGFVGACLQGVVDEYSLHGGDDKPDAYQQVLEVIARTTDKGCTLRELGMYCRAYRALGKDSREDLMARMREDGAIYFFNVGKAGKYFAAAYVNDPSTASADTTAASADEVQTAASAQKTQTNQGFTTSADVQTGNAMCLEIKQTTNTLSAPSALGKRSNESNS